MKRIAALAVGLSLLATPARAEPTCQSIPLAWSASPALNEGQTVQIVAKPLSNVSVMYSVYGDGTHTVGVSFHVQRPITCMAGARSSGPVTVFCGWGGIDLTLQKLVGSMPTLTVCGDDAAPPPKKGKVRS